jgi:hypothetical protein
MVSREIREKLGSAVPRERAEALRELAKSEPCGEEAVGLLLEGTFDESAAVRAGALRGLAGIGATGWRVRDRALEMLSDPGEKPEVKAIARDLCSSIGSRLGAMEKLLSDNPRKSVKIESIYVLSRAGEGAELIRQFTPDRTELGYAARIAIAHITRIQAERAARAGSGERGLRCGERARAR